MSIKAEKIALGVVMILAGIIAIYQAIFMFFIKGIEINRDLVQAIALAVLAVLLLVNGTLSICTRNKGETGNIVLGVLSIIGVSVGLIVWMLLQDFRFIYKKDAHIEIYVYALLCFIGAIDAEYSVMMQTAIKKHEKELWQKLQFNPEYLNEKYGHPQGVQKASYAKPMEMQNLNRSPYGQGTNRYDTRMMNHQNQRQVNPSFQNVPPESSSMRFSDHRKAYGYETAFSQNQTDDKQDVETDTYAEEVQEDLYK